MWEWEVQMFTPYGWECVTTEVDKASAIETRNLYRKEQFGYAYRIKRVRGES